MTQPRSTVVDWSNVIMCRPTSVMSANNLVQIRSGVICCLIDGPDGHSPFVLANRPTTATNDETRSSRTCSPVLQKNDYDVPHDGRVSEAKAPFLTCSTAHHKTTTMKSKRQPNIYRM